MDKKIAVVFSASMCLLFVIGIVLIFSAAAAGQNAGHQAIQKRGGSMDTWEYQQVITSTTDSYQTGGLVISLVGGFGLLGGGYILYKKV